MIKVKVNDTQRTVNNANVKVDNKWRNAYQIYTKVNGTWRSVWKYRWKANAWGNCNKVCGGGVQKRTVECQRSVDNGKSYSSDNITDDYCNKLGIKNTYSLSQTCNTQSCDKTIWLVMAIDDKMNLYYTNNLTSARNNNFATIFTNTGLGWGKGYGKYRDASSLYYMQLTVTPSWNSETGKAGKLYFKFGVWDTNGTHQALAFGVGNSQTSAFNNMNNTGVATSYQGAGSRMCMYRLMYDIDDDTITRVSCQHVQWDTVTFIDCGSFCSDGGWNSNKLCPNGNINESTIWS